MTDPNEPLRPAAPARRLPVGYVRFSDDGKLCHIAKEWNPASGSSADVVKALAGALGAQKGRETHFGINDESPCFTFSETGRAICLYAEGDGPTSVMEMTGTDPCPRLQRPPVKGEGR
jgi:hypothetical protein